MTLSDVALRAGVAPMTASRAVNGSGHVSDAPRAGRTGDLGRGLAVATAVSCRADPPRTLCEIRVAGDVIICLSSGNHLRIHPPRTRKAAPA